MTSRIGIIGGSGLYQLIQPSEQLTVETRFGAPSSPVSLGAIADRPVAFLTRHGSGHTVPPHLINHRANVLALKQVGCDAVLTSSAVGSLRAEYRPGDFALPDQFVDRTLGPPVTLYEGPEVVHVSVVDPYCPVLRESAAGALRGLGESFHPTATTLVFSGPRFSTRAESNWYREMGWDLLSMTQHPETTLIREAEMCCVNLSFVSDADSGTPDGSEPPVTAGMVWRRLEENQPRIRDAITAIVASLPSRRDCGCRQALADV